LNRYLEEGLGRWVAFSEHRPKLVLAAIALITALIGLYAWQNFAIDSDLGKLIRPAEDVQWYQSNEAFKRDFPESQQTAVVVVSGRDVARVDEAAGSLADAFRASAEFEFVFAPALDDFLRDRRAYFLSIEQLDDWISGVQYDYGAMLRLGDSPDLVNAAFTLADQVAATDGLRLPTSLATIAESFEAGLPDRLGLAIYPHLNPEGNPDHYVIIVVKGRQALDESLPNAQQVALLRSLIDSVVVPEGVRVRLTGEVPLAHEEISAALDGIGIAGTISLVLLAIILRTGVGSWRILGAIFCLLGVGVIWTLGFAVLAVGAFNTLALIFVVMFFGLGVDFAVHFALRLWESSTPDPDGDPEVHAVHEIGPALALCMLTSSIAFLSFLPTDYRGLAELGIISAAGMLIAFVLTLSLLPAFFSLYGLPAPAAGIPGWSAWLADLKPARVLTISALVALSAGWLARDLSFDYSVLALRDESTEAMSTLIELQDNQVTTDYSINLLARDQLEAAGLREALLALPEVGQVVTPADLVPDDQPVKRARLEALAGLIETVVVEPPLAGDPTEGLTDAVDYLREVRGEVGTDDQRLYDAFVDGLEALGRQPERLHALNQSLQEAFTAELAALLVLLEAPRFTLADLPEDLHNRMIGPDGRHLVTVMPAGPMTSRAATDSFVAAVSGVSPAVSGRAVVEWGVGNVAVRAFAEAVGVAVLAIAVLLIAYFRGLLMPLVVLLPLALTTLVTFAVINVSPLTLNMANILVIPLIFGLGVDTGIHVVHRYVATGSVTSLLASSTSRAVLISALTTIGTFFSLSFSPHKGAASVGMLLTIAISTMLLATFMVLPALLSLTKAGEKLAQR
jgi:hopanoid biosynthesis associated RND transporter like protein HpnN